MEVDISDIVGGSGSLVTTTGHTVAVVGEAVGVLNVPATSGVVATGGIINAVSGGSSKGTGVESVETEEIKKLKEKWGEGSFDDIDSSIEYHYKKHGEEVGANNVLQYLRKAKEFAKNLKGARKVGEVKGTTPGVIRYEKMGKYIDLAPNGDIISFGKFSR